MIFSFSQMKLFNSGKMIFISIHCFPHPLNIRSATIMFQPCRFHNNRRKQTSGVLRAFHWFIATAHFNILKQRSPIVNENPGKRLPATFA